MTQEPEIESGIETTMIQSSTDFPVNKSHVCTRRQTRMVGILLLSTFSILLAGCNLLSSDADQEPDVFEFDFTVAEHDWEPFFTDYPVGWGERMELTAEYSTLPEPLDTDTYSHFISAHNHSDDVKMLFRRQISGLEPDTPYLVSYTVEFATETPSNCFGIGGPPGEAVKVIAGSSTIKPEQEIDDESPYDDGFYLLNIQHLDDSAEWYNNAIMGNIANSRDCENGWEFELKEVNSGFGHDQVVTDENGEAWLLFGTRSGFEGRTNLFYTFFRAEFSKLPVPSGSI